LLPSLFYSPDAPANSAARDQLRPPVPDDSA
jgi:hypothetical protein